MDEADESRPRSGTDQFRSRFYVACPPECLITLGPRIPLQVRTRAGTMGVINGRHPTKDVGASRCGLASTEQALESVPVTESDERVVFS